jgi:hypothetical protein
MNRKRTTEALSGVLALLLAAPALSQSAALPSEYQSNPKALVKRVVENELAAGQDKSHFRFKLRKETPKGSSVKEIIETPRGSLARLVAINDQPPSEEQRKSDDARLNQLLRDPEEQEKKFKEQKEDGSRAETMVKLLPVAFIYTYAGTENTPDGEVVDYRFEPDPKFDPPSREAQVFAGMAGVLGLNVKYMRLYKIDAHLFKDVNFGWGILGRLDKNGTLYVEQHHIEGMRWEATRMFLNLTGKALFFKKLEFIEKEFASDFHRVPDQLSLDQAAEMLRKASDQMAAGGAGMSASAETR